MTGVGVTWSSDSRSVLHPGVRGALLAAAVVLASAITLAATGNPGYALIPLAAIGVGYAVWKAPLRWTFVAALGVFMLGDIAPRDAAGDVKFWQPPTHVLRLFLFENLKSATSIGILRFSGAELLLVLILVLAMLRFASEDPIDRRGRITGANVVPIVVALSLAALLALEGWGIARGGDVRQSLFQFRLLLWFPMLVAAALYAFRGPRDAAFLAWAVTIVACIKVAIGAYFYYGVPRPAGTVLQSVTSHNDSVLFVTVIAVWVAIAVFLPTRGRLVVAAVVCALMLLGMVINNRRTAFVSLPAILAVLFVLMPPRMKRKTLLQALYWSPLLAFYVIVGRNRTGAIFAPAASFFSAIQQNDPSSASRVAENYNLIYTLRQHPLLGSGWGHEYVEVWKGYDISWIFEQYRYIAHNSVLWLWTIGGPIGFTLLWLPLVVGLFLAARSYYQAQRSADRAIAYVAIAIIVAFVLQAWADMGTASWTTMGLLACALAMSSKLATVTGAWPRGARLVAGRSGRPGLSLSS